MATVESNVPQDVLGAVFGEGEDADAALAKLMQEEHAWFLANGGDAGTFGQLGDLGVDTHDASMPGQEQRSGAITVETCAAYQPLEPHQNLFHLCKYKAHMQLPWMPTNAWRYHWFAYLSSFHPAS